MEAEMPEASKAVLDISEGVSRDDYAQALNSLRDGMDSFRASQGWCSEFWDYIQRTISPVFAWDRYQEDVFVNADTLRTDAERAAELRNIRGRILTYVGQRIPLGGANEILRGAGLAEYTPEKTERTWRVNVGSFRFDVTAEQDPTAGIQEKFREVLASVGDTDADYHAGGVYASETSTGRVPAAYTVPLLSDYQ